MIFYNPKDLIVTESDLVQIISESQFSNPDLTKIENLIGELRQKYRNDAGYIHASRDPILLTISDLFCKVFGFNSFLLSISYSKFPNAWTAPISSSIDKWNYKKCIKKSNQGLRFTPEAKVNVMAEITTELFFDDKYTDREILAVLLHEIGHNFSDSINGTLGVFSNVKKILFIPYVLVSPDKVTNIGKGITNKIKRYGITNLPALADCVNAVKVLTGTLSYIALNISQVQGVLYGPVIALYSSFNSLIQNFVRNPIAVENFIFNAFGKIDEYTADSFPAMYGYGPDLASALTKMEHTNHTPIEDIFRSSDFGRLYYAFMVDSADFITAKLYAEPHPDTAKRLLNILNTLEQEYNKPYIDPKFKKETEKEIKILKQLIEDELANDNTDGNYWKIQYNKYILRTSNNKGPKHKMISDMLDKIENKIRDIDDE